MRYENEYNPEKFVYKSRFRLPTPEADFVCALGRVLGCHPEDALRIIIRDFANADRGLAREIFARARDDGRGPWK